MSHHAKRDRPPIRTYGRRPTGSATAGGGEPPAKRRKSGHAGVDGPVEASASDGKATGEEAAPKSPATGPPPAETDGAAERPAKGSILNYFRREVKTEDERPRRQSVKEDSSRELDTTSPPPERPRAGERRRRLLRIRPAILPPSDDDVQGEEEGDSDKENGTADGNEPERRPRPDVPPGNRNAEDAKRRRSSRRKPPGVQTTLNLSARPAFSECKFCNTVWNPLYPDDVRYHGKRHATVARHSKHARGPGSSSG